MEKYTLSVYVSPEAFEKLEQMKNELSVRTRLSISRSKMVELLIVLADREKINQIGGEPAKGQGNGLR
jgi:hypothetical protein